MMSKTSLMSTVALALTLATAVGAQGANQNQRAERSRGAQQDTIGRRGPRGPERMLLRGITLSSEQQTKLAELRRRERGDTTGFAARRAEMEKRFEQRVAAIRGILTPAQRTQFDKNVADAKANRPKADGRFGGPRERGGWRDQGGR